MWLNNNLSHKDTFFFQKIKEILDKLLKIPQKKYNFEGQ